MTNDFLIENLCIGIATCNRWTELRATLQALRDFGLGEVETLVVDDHSHEVCPPELQADFPRVRFERDEVSRRSVAQRNRIARSLTKKYWLHIDDDSNPVAGSVEAAVKYLMDHPQTICLALSLIEKLEVSPVSLDTAPRQVQRYTGCAALFNREIFVAIGGYREAIFHMGEEGELCARALGKGYATMSFPGLVVRHRRSSVNRSSTRDAYFQGRNRWLLAWWHFPMPYLLQKFVLCLPGTFVLIDRRHFPHACLGFCHAVIHGLQTWRLREPMSQKIYQKWQTLPWVSADSA